MSNHVMPGEARVYVGQAVQRLSLLVSAGRLDPAALAPRVDRVHAALEPAFAQQLRALPRRERPARFDALPQETQSHIDHAISVAAHRTINAHRADLRTQLHSTQRIQAPADAVPGCWHVDDGQRLSQQKLPVMPDQTEVRHSVQPLA